jgi:AraC family transcriptional regulator of adaptative response / DNA-3-methyladenine glycosylase II
VQLDPEACYRAVSSKDARFDGYFVTAVRTTGIYCRPSCPAVTPRRHNVEFFATAAAAHDHGYRACKRCRPDASPGSPEWDVRADAVARAMRLIADGVVDRDGVGGLARRLHYSERHVNRLVTDELGAGPLAIARAQRAQAARVLIETTTMPFTAVAFAAGFSSVRQFNDTVRAVFASSPSELRARRRSASTGAEVPTDTHTVDVELAVRRPYDLDAVLEFLGRRAVPGMEQLDGEGYRRTLALPHGHGVMTIRPSLVVTSGRPAVAAALRLDDWRDLAPAVRRVRRLLDLDADSVAIEAALSDEPVMAELVRAAPGTRVPGSVDPFETAVRAVIGQQVSVSGARALAGRVVAALGETLSPALAGEGLSHVFPAPASLACADPVELPLPARRRTTLVELASRVALGKVVLDAGADREEVRAALLDVPGIGSWTADYVLLRGLGDPDVFLPGDLGARRALARLHLDASAADRWRPWRSYALHHLWSLTTPPDRKDRP